MDSNRHWATGINNRALVALLVSLAFAQLLAPALAHPGSGIVVDRKGRIYFTDTGQGVWTIAAGKLIAHEGPAYHFMAIDLDARFTKARWPPFVEPSTTIHPVGADPTLLLSSDFPITLGRDGALYYPEVGKDDRVQVFRLAPSGDRTVLATLPLINAGKTKWLNGIAAGPGHSIYFTENAAIRRINQQGALSTIASNIVVPDSTLLPGVGPDLQPFLRGLDVTPEGTVYVAANGCCALLKITADGKVTPVHRTTGRWSPTGVAVSGDSVFILEYLHTPSGDRRDWIPRVTRLSPDGTSVVLSTVQRTPAAANPVPGPKAAD
jgi:hypothetical protein